MAMTFSSAGCTSAANDLTASSKKLDTILNNNLTSILNNTKNIYSSETAEELYAAFAKMKERFPDFIDAINSCAKYLNEVVAPAYAELEAKAAEKIQ